MTGHHLCLGHSFYALAVPALSLAALAVDARAAHNWDEAH
jgi:hypothetical protein